MKKLFLFITLAAFYGQARSQEISFGMRAGISRSSMVQNFADFANKDALTGFTGGFYLKAKILGFFVMPEVMYNQRGGNISGIGSNKIHYIDVPLLAGKQFFKVLRVNGGPVLQFAMSSDKISDNSTYTNESEVKNFVLGLQLGAGVDISRFSFDVRYDTGLSDAAKVVVNAKAGSGASDITYTSRTSMWLFTLGYRFVKI